MALRFSMCVSPPCVARTCVVANTMSLSLQTLSATRTTHAPSVHRTINSATSASDLCLASTMQIWKKRVSSFSQLTLSEHRSQLSNLRPSYPFKSIDRSCLNTLAILSGSYVENARRHCRLSRPWIRVITQHT